MLPPGAAVELYRVLYSAYGPQRWWPAAELFEMMAGAVVVQNTAWTQTAKALTNLRRAGVLSPAGVRDCPPQQLEELLRPAGYFRIKTRRLHSLATFVGDAPERAVSGELATTRARLLGVHGVGRETADSILCYGGGYPVFVVDAYTRRIFSRLGWAVAGSDYDMLRRAVEGDFGLHPPGLLEGAARELGEFHAVIVRHAKRHCRSKPVCAGCPVTWCGRVGVMS